MKHILLLSLLLSLGGCCAPASVGCYSSPQPCGVATFLDADGASRFYRQYSGSIYVQEKPK